MRVTVKNFGVVLAAVACGGVLHAANPGDLDTSFGPTNKIPGVSVAGLWEVSASSTRAITTQNDGRILVAGNTWTAATSMDFVVMRMAADGAMDLAFGNSGFAVTDLRGGQDDVEAVAVQGDGKILVAGQSWRDGACKMAAVRYNQNGTLDGTFASNGVLVVETSGGSDVYGIAVQADGKILLAGSGHEWNARSYMLLSRLNQDGSLDDSFGNAGMVGEDFGKSAHGMALLVQPDGKVVMAGRAWDTAAGGWAFAAARFNANGALDQGFGASGKFTKWLGDPNCQCHDIAIQPDGKLVLGGEVSVTNRKHFALLRLTTSGQLDTTFGDNGVVLSALGEDRSACRAVVVLDNGAILAAGGAGRAGFDNFFTIARYDQHGALDANFGENGVSMTYLWNGAEAMAVDGDRVYLAGNGGYSVGSRNFCVACYTLTGYRDGGPAPGANLVARQNQSADPRARRATWNFGVYYPGVPPATIIAGLDDPDYGTVSDNGDGTLTYCPRRLHAGYDAFTYTDLDGRVGIVSIYMVPYSVNDYDGDGLADPAVYGGGVWQARLSGRDYALVEPAALGGAGWAAVSADYDGDGLADPGVYQEATGAWRVQLSGSGYIVAGEQLGALGGTGWRAVPADYDGDGSADPAVYHEATGVWRAMASRYGYAVMGDQIGQLGGLGWRAVPADYDNDGMADPAVYHEATGAWRVRLSGSGYAVTGEQLGWLGGTGWRAVPADYDGDGLTDPAVYNATAGTWLVLPSGANYIVREVPFGGAGRLPAPSDYDGDGLADFAVYDPATGAWELLLSGSSYAGSGITVGGPGFVPVNAAITEMDGD